jgi:hypothetical protein
MSQCFCDVVRALEHKNQWGFEPSTFLIGLGPLRLILHWTEGTSPSSVM